MLSRPYKLFLLKSLCAWPYCWQNVSSCLLFPEKNCTAIMQATRASQTASFFSAKDMENCKGGLDVQKALSDDHLSENQVDITGADDSICGGDDAQIGRPVSPGPLTLMCDEKDALLMQAASPNRVLIHSCNADLYVEQERLVLASFQDCLNRLIYHGNLKGKILHLVPE